MREQDLQRFAKLLDERGITEEDIHVLLETEPLKLALNRFAAKKRETAANGRTGITQVIQEVEYCNRPYTDEHGKYVSYKCCLCGTPAKIRQGKVRESKKTEDPRQHPLPETGSAD